MIKIEAKTVYEVNDELFETLAEAETYAERCDLANVLESLDIYLRGIDDWMSLMDELGSAGYEIKKI